jgi:hypothetical protein
MGFGGGNPYNLTSTVTAGIVSAKAEILEQAEFNLYSNRRSGKPRKQRRRFSKHGDLIGINTDFFHDRFLCWLFFCCSI